MKSTLDLIRAISKPGEEWREVTAKGVTLYASNLARIYAPGQICKFERVRNGKVQQLTQRRKGRILAPVVANTGYYEVGRKEGGPRVKFRVHRLVGMAWVAGYSEDLTINHKDGNKLNNLPENLEWVSLAENTKHQWETGLVDIRGERHPRAKLTTKQVVYMRRLYRQGIPAHTIDIVAGVTPGYTKALCDRKNWAHVKQL